MTREWSGAALAVVRGLTAQLLLRNREAVADWLAGWLAGWAGTAVAGWLGRDSRGWLAGGTAEAENIAGTEDQDDAGGGTRR